MPQAHRSEKIVGHWCCLAAPLQRREQQYALPLRLGGISVRLSFLPVKRVCFKRLALLECVVLDLAARHIVWTF